MNVLYQIVSVVGLAGVVGIGIWVGMIQTKVGGHDKDVVLLRTSHENLSSKLESDHDLLIRLDEKVSAVLQKLDNLPCVRSQSCAKAA
jgi:hypothetical protein